MPLETPPDMGPLPLRLRALSLSAMMDQPASLFRALLPVSTETLTSLHIFVIKSGAPLHERLLEAQPSLPSSLLHLSIATHWVPLSDSLVDFVASCTCLRTLTLHGVVPHQLHHLVGALSSSLAGLEFTIPATFAWHGYSVEAFFDRLLREQGTRHLRFLTATRVLESLSDDKPARKSFVRGAQACSCLYEVTARAFGLIGSGGCSAALPPPPEFADSETLWARTTASVAASRPGRMSRARARTSPRMALGLFHFPSGDRRSVFIMLLRSVGQPARIARASHEPSYCIAVLRGQRVPVDAMLAAYL